MAWPARVDIRCRKPCFRARFRVLGWKVRFISLSSSSQIWVADAGRHSRRDRWGATATATWGHFASNGAWTRRLGVAKDRVHSSGCRDEISNRNLRVAWALPETRLNRTCGQDFTMDGLSSRPRKSL